MVGVYMLFVMYYFEFMWLEFDYLGFINLYVVVEEDEGGFIFYY